MSPHPQSQGIQVQMKLCVAGMLQAPHSSGAPTLLQSWLNKAGCLVSLRGHVRQGVLESLWTEMYVPLAPWWDARGTEVAAIPP